MQTLNQVAVVKYHGHVQNNWAIHFWETYENSMKEYQKSNPQQSPLAFVSTAIG